MTFLQYFWPCAIFLSLYILRLRFQPHQIDNCQFPTRQLPPNNLLPFFQSYICTIENQCQSVNEYEEVTNWDKAAWVSDYKFYFNERLKIWKYFFFLFPRITPLLNIVQTFLNEKDLYDGVVNLPKTMEFIPLITRLATHSKFKYIESKRNFGLIKKLNISEKFWSNIEKLVTPLKRWSMHKSCQVRWFMDYIEKKNSFQYL